MSKELPVTEFNQKVKQFIETTLNNTINNIESLKDMLEISDLTDSDKLVQEVDSSLTELELLNNFYYYFEFGDHEQKNVTE